MADVFSIEERSRIMALIKSKDTVPEKLVFAYLRSKGIYFQKHYNKVPGCPDIALPRKKLAVFIDGEFWHGKNLQKLISRRGLYDTWTIKISNNVKRDKTQRDMLISNGWRIHTVWDGEIRRKRTRDIELKKIAEFLSYG